ncbi:MAG TPA: hypothetical protein VL484_00290 [Vicinamibacterales bacterium]|jgi:hypothetical protein|nr:hypothetical protein [Vicinamibacterales bacterium]
MRMSTLVAIVVAAVVVLFVALGHGHGSGGLMRRLGTAIHGSHGPAGH